jgi:lactoylglutathione lyase
MLRGRLAWMSVALASIAATWTPAAQTPQVIGLSHIAVLVSDLAKARGFYQDLLGLSVHPMVLDGRGAPRAAIARIGSSQWIELIEAPPKGEGQLDHVALRVDDAVGMRQALVTRGLKPLPSRADPFGNPSFTTGDPDGHVIEFVEYAPGGLILAQPMQASPTAVSGRLLHAGILVGDLDASVAFYGMTLGFTEFWRGAGATSKTLSWVNMRAPVGTDYLEFMLYETLPAPNNRGSAHHACLLVQDMDKALAAIEASPGRAGYTRPLEIRTGINRKRQLNLFDPDGTRVELMEPDTVDGEPAPSSTLPPPKRGKH